MTLGQPRYFTGKLCRNGHNTWRATANWTCGACSAVGGTKQSAARTASRASRVRVRREFNSVPFKSGPDHKNSGPRAVAKAAGNKRYFDGRPCKVGHIAERLTSSRECVMCAAPKLAALAERTRADVPACQARAKASRGKNSPRVRQNWVKWYAENRDAVLAKAAERWKKAQPERDRLAAIREANKRPVKSVAAQKWRKNNPEMVRACYRRRRARERGLEGHHTAQDVANLHKLQKGKCAFCRISLQHGVHVDHIMPVAAGGTDWPSNLQLLCPTCNRSKGAKHPIDWARSKGLLL